jgi:N-acetylglucosamine kinase-like BadF-type ATPase
MDGGCAYDIGSRALLAAHKAHDSRGAATTLTRTFLRRLRLPRVEDLVRWAYHPAEGQHERICGLARVVADCAAAGDAVADTILRHGVGELLK